MDKEFTQEEIDELLKDYPKGSRVIGNRNCYIIQCLDDDYKPIIINEVGEVVSHL